MKKFLNNVFKWAFLVLISYSLIFTAIIAIEGVGIMPAIKYKTSSIDNNFMYNMEKEELEEICKNYQRMIDESMNSEIIEDVEYLSENQIEKELEFNELYKKYPAGCTMLLRDVVSWETMSALCITSLTMGVAVGTAIYLMLDEDRKGLKLIISLYVIFIILLGFVEGIQSVVGGENLTLLDKWIFPETYIIPTTAAFILAIVVKILRQKNIAKELNKRLEEKKDKKIQVKNEHK